MTLTPTSTFAGVDQERPAWNALRSGCGPGSTLALSAPSFPSPRQSASPLGHRKALRVPPGWLSGPPFPRPGRRPALADHGQRPRGENAPRAIRLSVGGGSASKPACQRNRRVNKTVRTRLYIGRPPARRGPRPGPLGQGGTDERYDHPLPRRDGCAGAAKHRRLVLPESTAVWAVPHARRTPRRG